MLMIIILIGNIINIINNKFSIFINNSIIKNNRKNKSYIRILNLVKSKI